MNNNLDSSVVICSYLDLMYKCTQVNKYTFTQVYIIQEQHSDMLLFFIYKILIMRGSYKHVSINPSRETTTSKSLF